MSPVTCVVQDYFSDPCQLCPALATMSALSSKWLLVFKAAQPACSTTLERHLLRLGMEKGGKESNGPSLDTGLAHQVRVALV